MPFNIEYEYQKHYPLQPEDRNANFAAYRPDFYFPGYEIWHELYGIDRNGNIPSWFAVKHPFNTPDCRQNGLKYYFGNRLFNDTNN